MSEESSRSPQGGSGSSSHASESPKPFSEEPTIDSEQLLYSIKQDNSNPIKVKRFRQHHYRASSNPPTKRSGLPKEDHGRTRTVLSLNHSQHAGMAPTFRLPGSKAHQKRSPIETSNYENLLSGTEMTTTTGSSSQESTVLSENGTYSYTTHTSESSSPTAIREGMPNKPRSQAVANPFSQPSAIHSILPKSSCSAATSTSTLIRLSPITAFSTVSITKFILYSIYLLIYSIVVSSSYLILLYGSLAVFSSVVQRQVEVYPFSVNLTSDMPYTMPRRFLPTPQDENVPGT